MQRLKKSEIRYLISKYKDKLNEKLSDKDRFSYIQHISQLKGLLKDAYEDDRIVYTKSTCTASLRVKNLIYNYFNRLDVSNRHYILEAEVMTDLIINALDWEKLHGPYSNNILALSIIDEILNHYSVDKDIMKLLVDDDISIDKFIRLSVSIHKWFDKNYWSI